MYSGHSPTRNSCTVSGTMSDFSTWPTLEGSLLNTSLYSFDKLQDILKGAPLPDELSLTLVSKVEIRTAAVYQHDDGVLRGLK